MTVIFLYETGPTQLWCFVSNVDTVSLVLYNQGIGSYSAEFVSFFLWDEFVFCIHIGPALGVTVFASYGRQADQGSWSHGTDMIW